MSKNRFREISSSVHKIAKFKYFVKAITCSKSPNQVLQSYIQYIHILKIFKTFSDSHSGAISESFRENCSKSREIKIFFSNI